MTSPSIPELEDSSFPFDEELLGILEEFVHRVEQGQAIDGNDLVARRPEMEQQLRAYFESLLLLNQARCDVNIVDVEESALLDRRGTTFGDYKIVRETGRGGMGVVYEATQISLDRRVALKVLPFAAMLDPKQIARFLIEAQSAAQLQHPHIVPVYSVGCEQGIHYYSMQFIDGHSVDWVIDELRSQVASRRRHDSETARGFSLERLGDTELDAPISVQRREPVSDYTNGELISGCGFPTTESTRSPSFMRAVARLGIQAAEAIQHAHDFGIIHRDIKPSNMLIDKLGQLWLTDFGLARWQSQSSITLTGDVVGTVRYMSPEQAQGNSALVDGRTDIYSLGVTLYELLTLHKAFDTADRTSFLRQIENQEPVAPRRLNPGIPVDLETIVLKAMSKRRSERYQNAKEMLEDLRRFVNDEPIQARPPTLADRAAKWGARHRSIVTVAFVFVVLSAVVSATSAIYVLRQQSRTVEALHAAEASLALADSHFRQARGVVDQFGVLASERLRQIPGAEAIRHELLADTLHYYQRFIEQADNKTGLRADLAVTHFKVAELHEQLGAEELAIASYEESARILRQLQTETPTISKSSSDLAKCYNNIGLIRANRGEAQPAIRAYLSAIELQRQLIVRQSRAKDHERNLALVMGNLALLEGQTGQIAESREHFREAIEIERRLVAIDPNDVALRYDLAMNLNNLSQVDLGNNPDDALASNLQAVTILRELATAKPDEPYYQSDLALALNNQGALHGRISNFEAAREAYAEAIERYQRLVQRSPAVARFRFDLAVTGNNLGRVLIQLDQLESARESLIESREALVKLVSEFPNDLRYRSCLGGAANNLGLVHERQGEVDEALAAYRLAVDSQQFCWEHTKDVTRYSEFLATSYDNLARLLSANGSVDDAAEIVSLRRDLQNQRTQVNR